MTMTTTRGPSHGRMTKPRIPVAAALSLSFCVAIVGCSRTVADTVEARSADTTVKITLPPTSGTFDYQLGGAYDALPADIIAATDASTNLDIVVRDSEAEPLPGAYSVCYVNGFQTQPDQAELWADDADVLLHDGDGDLVVDPDWPDEYIFDPTTEHKREVILDRLGEVIDDCGSAGFDAVEIDNLDTSERFDGIDEGGAHALARAYVERAHEAGLAIAQKNAAELTGIAHDKLGFDFAVTEECAAFDECEAYTEVYGPHVLEIEYPDTLAEAGLDLADACAHDDSAPLTILRDRDLVSSGEDGYIYESCSGLGHR